ncbi:MAG: AMP-binding protein [Burkholderiales bacterium]|nr:AMP-binding protein [Burkholderiales bacterium]
MSRPVPARTLGGLVDAAAAALGDREAVVFGGARRSFAQLRDETVRAAKGFLALGIAPGEHVMLFLPNSLEWLHAFYGLARIGAVLVPVNTRFRSVDLDYVLRQSDATTLVIADSFGGTDYCAMVRALVPALDDAGADLAAPGFPRLRRIVVVGDAVPAGALGWQQVLAAGAGVSDAALEARARAVDPSAPALMLYTSGTTGAPKGALHSHAMLRTVADGANRLGITARDAILLFLPLFHSMGLYLGGMLFLVSGARLVLMDRFDAGGALALIERERVSLLLGFDTHYFDLLEHPDFRTRSHASVRLGMVPAGAAGVEPLARRVNRELCRSFSGYGSSECGTGIALSFLDAGEDERCRGSGFPVPGYAFQTRDPDAGTPAPAGVPGELWVRGYGVMLGYYGKPAETAQAFDGERWFRTGDMAVIDADGFVRYMGRYKDMLKVGGENVDPTEVEAFLEGHPDIAQVKLVGIPDARLGEAPVACVIPRAGCAVSVDAVRAFCSGRIASFKTPRQVVLVDAFPMTTTGKVQRAALREAVMRQVAVAD